MVSVLRNDFCNRGEALKIIQEDLVGYLIDSSSHDDKVVSTDVVVVQAEKKVGSKLEYIERLLNGVVGQYGEQNIPVIVLESVVNTVYAKLREEEEVFRREYRAQKVFGEGLQSRQGSKESGIIN